MHAHALEQRAKTASAVIK